MLIKILGGIDVIGALFLFIIAGGINLYWQLLIIIGTIFMLKSLLGFFRDFGSWVDFFTGMFFLFSALVSLPIFLLVIGGFLLLQKGIVSFL